MTVRTFIKAENIWASHPGFTFADTNSDVYMIGTHHIFVFLRATGTITTGNAGYILLGTLKNEYIPKLKQTSGLTINCVTSGQRFAHAVVTINTDGTVYLTTGESSKTYGNTSYPWTTTSGTAFDWWI